MINVTYTIPPTFRLEGSPIASRILTTNLVRDKRINESFSEAVAYTNMLTPEIPDYVEKWISTLPANIGRHLREKGKEFIFPSVVFNTLEDYIVDTLDNEYILITILSPEDLYTIKILLNAGRKVVMGGTPTFLWSFEFLRKTLSDMGTKNLENLIIVKGHVGLDTDIYSIIKNWKDVVLTNFSATTLYDCDEDYLSDQSLIFRNSGVKYDANFIFRQRCFYSKCNHCNHRRVKRVNFIEGLTTRDVTSNIRHIMKKFEANRIFLVDSYLEFLPDTVDILIALRKDFFFHVYAGVDMMLNDEYCDYINAFIDSFMIGFETLSPFALKYLNKNHTVGDVDKLVDKIIKRIDRDKVVIFNMMVDLPYESREDIIENYRKIKEIKQRMTDEGFEKFRLNPIALYIQPQLNLIDNKFIRRTHVDDWNVVGRNYVKKQLDDMDLYYPLPEDIEIHYTRHDSNGNVLPSDFELVDMDFLS